jgi:carbonic anhydrase
VKEGVAQEHKDQQNEGCNIYGTLRVNKVGGSFHFAPGKSYTVDSVHAHDVHEYMKGENYDWTHIIHELGFGEAIGFNNPLDNVKKEANQGKDIESFFLIRKLK